MYILAFKDGHDPAACLMQDGRIIAACEEERLNRIKHSPGKPPWGAVAYCLSVAGVTLDQVDHVIYASTHWPTYFLKILFSYLRHPPLSQPDARYAAIYLLKGIRRMYAHVRGEATYQKIWRQFGAKPRRMHFIDHHLGHAASAFLFSEFERATIVTMDGKGDATAVLVAEGTPQGIRVLKRYGVSHSLGFLYTSFTHYLGFEVNDGEYKVMGLAPYGVPRYPLEEVLRCVDGTLVMDSHYAYYGKNVKLLEERFHAPRRLPEGPIEQLHKDVAASLQKRLEEVVVDFVRHWIKRTGHVDVCLAGGVALNVKMNMVVREQSGAGRTFVQPAAGDAGITLGAAGWLFHKLTGRRPEPLKDLYFGPECSEEQIASAIRSSGLAFERPADIARAAAELLADGKVVGWFQGRMEFGPRALGNRSILADPRREDMKDIVNEKIKFREPFRPFCPSLLSSDIPRFVEDPRPAPYMIEAFRVKPDAAKVIPAVVHVDNTIRPQEVSPGMNPPYERLIGHFKQLTGVGVVMDTSLNRRGEPMICKPEEAIDLFLKTGLDALALGPFLLKKK